MEEILEDDNIDVGVDAEIANCINPSALKSFFLFAGAGSGKTRSLVTALDTFYDKYGRDFQLKRQRIAIITYTNAACDEIMHRTKYDPLFQVSTIHSFVWELIKTFQEDIREWVRSETAIEIAELRQAAAKGRPGTKAAIDRESSLQSKLKLLEEIDSIRLFTYSPTGENRGRSSLNHSQVIKMAADFLMNQPLMQKILICKYPIVFIDESQDTKKELIEALFAVEEVHQSKFCLGLFGDTMQRIYSDGKLDLGVNLPQLWLKPQKRLNHRCPKRVIRLINKIRSEVDGQEQLPRNDQIEGIVRLFIAPSNESNKILVETQTALKMATLTGDEGWKIEGEVKKLILEHHMAASRMGFMNIFEPLSQVDSLRTSLLDGSVAALRFFTQFILPLVNAQREGDEFEVARIIKSNTDLLSDAIFKKSTQQPKILKTIQANIKLLAGLWDNNTDPSLIEILVFVATQNLFVIPEPMLTITKRLISGAKKLEEAFVDEIDENIMTTEESAIKNWEEALSSPFSEVKAYYDYFAGNSSFGTHQGVKGLQFPRVMAILDDQQARGFLFSYEKLFGVKELTATDVKNAREGKDSTLLRTLRLFYVICSRTEQSLAIIAYTENTDALKNNALKQGWFSEQEIEII